MTDRTERLKVAIDAEDGPIGTACVAALVKGELEKPSDFDGVGYIALDTAGVWKSLLARELHHAHVPFDHEKVFSA